MRSVCLAAVLVAFALTFTPAAAQPGPRPPQPADFVASLVSPAMFGRGYSQAGHLVAAEYIRHHFKSAGLEPLSDDYFQPFTIAPDIVTSVPTLTIDNVHLTAGRDFVPTSGSPTGAASGVAAISVGHGLFLPDSGVNDFAGVAPGSVLVVEAGLPDSLARLSVPTDAARDDFKVAAAAAVNATAIILVVDRLTYAVASPDAPIPVFKVLRSSIANPETVSFDVRTARNVDVQAVNVLGILRGTSFPDSVVVLTAHYDHLGGFGDSVFFAGANDNASGTALLMDLAYHFARNPPEYTLAFAAFSGEELGLLGSRAFVLSQLIPLEQIHLAFNFDMVASGGQGVVVSGGTDFPVLYDRLARINDHLMLGPIRPRMATPISDHYPFVEAGRPGLFIYANQGTQPYHHVDDVAATLEWDEYLKVRELAVTFLTSDN